MSKIDQRQTEQKPAQEFAIITKAKDLVKHTFMMTSERRFPKKYRFTIVNRLHDLTLDIFQHIQEANELDLTDPQEYRERRYEQKKALTECKTVLFLIELSFEKELISSEQCAEWTRHVMNVKNMTAKWRKQDRERFAALQQNRGITPRRYTALKNSCGPTTSHARRTPSGSGGPRDCRHPARRKCGTIRTAGF